MLKGMGNRDAFVEARQELDRLEARTDLAKATFSGGCFWCMEGPFEAMPGVLATIAGYAGGSVKDPTYEQVVSDMTGHRESVQVYYDSHKVSFADLLKTYWLQVDPTDAGGQFYDRGEHNTTAVFYRIEAEKAEIEKQIKELNESRRLDKPVVTLVLPFTTFYPAEDYHQNFYKKSAQYYKQYAKGSGRADYVEVAKRWYEEREELRLAS